MLEEQSNDEKPRKDRSPSFPFIALGKAVDRARAFAESHRRAPARLISVANTWNYGPKSSGLQQTIAALKAFGLMDDVGTGDERKFQLTELSWRILMDSRPGAKEQAIKDAALRPRLIAEYAEQWLPERPSDNHCVSELHLDRGFTQEAARVFLRVFDDTIRYANLAARDKPSAGDDSEHEPEDSSPMEPSPSPQSGSARQGGWIAKVQAQAKVAEQRASARATLPLPEGMAALEIPPGLSKNSLEALRTWVKVMVDLAELTSAQVPSQPSSPQSEPQA